jgi:hypothetical protein
MDADSASLLLRSEPSPTLENLTFWRFRRSFCELSASEAGVIKPALDQVMESIVLDRTSSLVKDVWKKAL